MLKFTIIGQTSVFKVQPQYSDISSSVFELSRVMKEPAYWISMTGLLHKLDSDKFSNEFELWLESSALEC